MDAQPLRSRLPINLITGLVFVFIAGVGFYVATTPAPAIVRDLRDLPEVARVDFTGPEDPALAVVHIRDVHLPPKEQAAVEGLDYPTLLRQVDWVQRDQMEIMRYLIRRHAVKAVFSEGLSKDNMAGLTIRLDMLRDMATLERLGKLDASELRQQNEITLTVGTVGRLVLAKEIDHALPLEDEAALQDAKPVAGGKIAPDDAKIQARRRAMVRNLPTSGLAVVILGSHDLGPYLPAGTLYVRVTPRSYSE